MPDQKANIILDSSKIDLFSLCEMRYYYRHIMKRGLPIIDARSSSSLIKGTLVHTALESYYNSYKYNSHKAVESYHDRVNLALQSMQTRASDKDVMLDENEIKLISSTLEEYFDYWRSEDEFMEVLGVEEPFLYVLFEDEYVRVAISGKIDLVVNIPKIGNAAGYTNLPIDHKTFSRSSYVSRLSNQFINYAAVLESPFLMVNRIGLQKTLKPEDKFIRTPLTFDPEFIREWKDNLTKVILGRYMECLSANDWTMNFTSCLKFNRLCEYHDICDSSGKEAKIFKLNEVYVPLSEWDVTDSLNDS